MEAFASTACRAACLAGAVALAAACARRETPAGGGAVEDTSPGGRAAARVRAHYGANDATAAGAWTWTAPGGRVYVLVDVQSTLAGIVQARADLWIADDSVVTRLGQSDILPSSAEIGAYAFEDLTGDGMPDLFGFVADSAGVAYPVFVPGGRGALAEEIAVAAPQWRFVIDEEHTPVVVRGPTSACALQLWVAEPDTGQGAEGWRWLALLPDGRLGTPQAAAPACGAEPAGQPGVQQKPRKP